MPDVHAIHVDALVADHRPDGHNEHCDDAVPGIEKVPAEHAVHALDPAVNDTYPAKHVTHDDNDDAFTDELAVPAGHGVHALDPDVAYEPDTHCIHEVRLPCPILGCDVPPGH